MSVSPFKKEALNGYELDRKLLSLEEEKPRKVMQQSFNVEGIFSEERLSRERKEI